MPPTDASADAGPVPVHPGRPYHPGRSGPAEDTRDCEDTLDLRLPAELHALFTGKTPRPDVGERPGAATRGTPTPGPLDSPDLLDHVDTWGPTPTPVGSFQLVPVHMGRDLPVISRWMNDPAVAAFWQLAGSRAQTEEYLRTQLAGDGRTVPCLGLLDGTPMSYWEIYRADLDPLARRYPARPHDTGLHLLIGDASDRGRGLGSALLRAVADLVLDRRPACARVVAEPDLHNTPSVAAFLNAGYRYAAEVDLPGKRAALMMRDRSLRHLM
ncbi:GNAT family N-acetyltransferase [Streptomyces arenae]|uniref:GNAT family N-acetyltransferase n=1 Tax=Streptomyces arenae TaxID=29301 RepID=UPI002657ACD0|nr:GNAT family N-acetyltransferase [Streptomyces arenae]MCG7206287.1 acetyltransferase [Streptomyces arenae]